MSVILSTGGSASPGGAGLGVPGHGKCLVPGSAWSCWGGVWSGGVPGEEPPDTATAAGGTHPTGMHYC